MNIKEFVEEIEQNSFDMDEEKENEEKKENKDCNFINKGHNLTDKEKEVLLTLKQEKHIDEFITRIWERS